MVPYLSYFPFPSPLSIRSEESIKDMTAIAVHFLKKHYGEAHLITDKSGAKLFCDIGFTTIDLELENHKSILNEYNEIWSLGKLFSYVHICKKNKAFLHIDNDVFLIKKLPLDLINKNVFAQNLEIDAFAFYNMEIFYENCPNKHFMKNQYRNLGSCNLGVFGGQDIGFIKDYAEKTINLILDKDNVNFWKNIKFPIAWQKAAIAEQYFLSQYAQELGKQIFFLKDFKTEEGYQNEYSHLMNRKFIPKFEHIIKDMRLKIVNHIA